MSVLSTSTANYLSRGATFPSGSADFTLGCWCRVNSYATSFTQVFGVSNGAGNGFGCDTAEILATDLCVFIYNGANFPVAIASGSYTGWVWFAIVHVGGTNVYTVYWRKEGQSVLSSSPQNVGGEITGFTNFNVFWDGGGPAVNTNIRSFFVQTTAMSAATLLAVSQNLIAPSGTNDTYLDLANATSPGTNTGTGGNFTVHGTLTTDPSDPDPELFPGAMLFAAGTTS